MKTSLKNQQPQNNSQNNNYRDRPRCEETNEPQGHLHENYRHWAWLSKPQ